MNKITGEGWKIVSSIIHCGVCFSEMFLFYFFFDKFILFFFFLENQFQNVD